jgi:radical SAM superfamily enzyme YgiQ (UPF0313 family)
LYVAAYLEKHGVDVCVYDMRDLPIATIPEANWYGISATTPEYPVSEYIARTLKERAPCKVILGGPHASGTPDTIDPIFDHVVIGEGEVSALSIIRHGFTGRFNKTTSLDSIDSKPFPARHLLPRDSVVSTKLCRPGENATTMIVSRGCAYDCSYCASKVIWGRRVRFRSVENVCEEINECIYNGIRSFRFADDTMTLNPTWLRKFCQYVPRNISWRTHTRIDHADLTSLMLMREAGCYDIGFGVEDPRPQILKRINKGVRPVYYCAIQNAHDARIKSRVYFMIGLPGQDKHTADTFIQYIEEKEPDAVDLSTMIPLPGSDIYNNPGKYGIKLKNYAWSDSVFTLGLYGNEYEKDFLFEHDVLSNEELKEQRYRILEYITRWKLDKNR